MKHEKLFWRFVTVLEAVGIAGSVLLSLYLLYRYLEYGEQAVNGMAVETETRLIQTSAEETETIRVRILDDGYKTDLFEEITVTGAEGMTVEWGTYAEDYSFAVCQENEVPEEEKAVKGSTVQKENSESSENSADMSGAAVFTVRVSDMQIGEIVCISPLDGGTLTVTSLKRQEGAPEYEGILYIYRLEDGLALVNVLELEKYLYAVVSSEMPSYYPTEALKAQAVCARTYAVQCMDKNKNGKTIADLDDSVRFQVYNNYQSTTASQEAVDATCNEILTDTEIQYYSTSCLSENREDLGEEQAFREFLLEIPSEEAEYGSAWLRWKTELSITAILEKLAEEYDILADELDEISIEQRSGNGQAQTLQIRAGGEIVEIEGEYAIRYFLSPEKTEVELMDGTAVADMYLLPSAFFYIDRTETDAIAIYGGGYGHGNGMSQCGAAQMAADGASYVEILEYYYDARVKSQE